LKSVLVTGACGLLGQHLVNRLKTNYKIVAVDISQGIFDEHENLIIIKSDLTDSGEVVKIITQYKPDIIYNCAAYNDVDGCELNREKAHAVNVKLVEDIIGSGAKRLIHYSSDYVFNGEHGPYAEEDPTEPIGYYGETKLNSEKSVLNSQGNHLILRTNVVFGNGVNIRPNFVTWLVESLKQGDEVKIATDQHNNPIHADNLAEASIEAEEKDLTGILHLAGNSYLSRYDSAILTADYFGLDKKLVLPVKTSELAQKAKRPLRGGLKIDRAKNLLQSRLLGFDEALRLL
jgi:dTDP-4-dehydrorhamnose reductase